ncbi:unnamed protein product [Closterium sp. NIES-53]
MENVFDHYDLLEVMEGTEKRSENNPEKSPWVRKSAQGYLLLGQALGSSQIHHIKPFLREPEKGPKAWAALKGVHAPATATVAVSPLEQFRQCLDLRKGVAEVLVAVEKPKAKANPVIQPWRLCNQVLAHLGMTLGSLGSSQINHIKPFQHEPEKGQKAWAALKGVHAPAIAAVAVVLERQVAALRIEEDEAVDEGVQKFFDLLTRLEGADLNYSELQKKTKMLALLPESWSSLIINLNRDLPRLSLEDVKRAILQEDFRRQDEGEADLAATTSMEAAGVADTAATTRAMDAVADGSTESATIVTRTDICGGRGGGAASMKSAGNESESRDDRFSGQFFFVSTQAPAGPEKDEGFEEPAAVGKVTLHSLDYWPSPVKHVTSALGQRAVVKGMGKAMLKGADGKMVGLKNVLWVPNLDANLISVRRLQKAGMDTSSKGAKTYTARLGERILWEPHEDRDVYNEMW